MQSPQFSYYHELNEWRLQVPILAGECTESPALSFKNYFKNLRLTFEPSIDMWYNLRGERSFIISPKCFKRSLCVACPRKLEP